MFAIQDEIAHAITESLKIALASPVDEPIVRKATANLEAYHLYLRGRFLVNRLNGQFEALFAARDAFQQAVALDPEYAAAYAGLSEAYSSLAYLTFVPTREASEAALAAAQRAVALDPGLAEAHTAVGWTKTLFAIDMATAEQDFLRAIELAPSFAPAHGTTCCSSRPRPVRRGACACGATRQLDPVWLRGPFNIAITLICARRFEKAERQVREIMALDPTSRARTGSSAPPSPARDGSTRRSPRSKKVSHWSIARRCSWRCSACGTRAPDGAPMRKRS